MKPIRSLMPGLAAILTLGLFACVTMAQGENTKSLKPATNASATNADPTELPVPVSIFDLNLKPVKDPFFPNSLRQAVNVVTTNAAPSITSASFQLKGLSGASDGRLALINNRTMAVGESDEITIASGQKIRIHVLQIKENSVVIHVANQADSMEVFLSKGAQ